LEHENSGEDGAVSWPHAVDAQGNPPTCSGPLMSSKTTFNHVVHVVRCPRDVVSALQTHTTCSLKYIRDTLKLDFKDHALRTPIFFMSAWLRWNQHIQNYADSRYRIDEMLSKNNFISICNLAGFHHGGDLVLPIAQLNHRHHTSFTWAQLRSADEGLAKQLHDKAREYDFDESCLDDGKSFVEEQSLKHASTVITIDESGIIFYWERASSQNMCAREICFEDIETAREHLELMHNTTLSNLAFEMAS